MAGVLVRRAERQDLEALVDLLGELDRFYGDASTESHVERLAGVEAALFAPPPAAYALLAWAGSSLAGFAAYSFLWPAAGVSRSLYLKELYVAEHSRRQGVGRLLMEEIIRIARVHRCSRVEWTTEEGNLAARRFYSAIEAVKLEDKLFYRAGT